VNPPNLGAGQGFSKIEQCIELGTGIFRRSSFRFELLNPLGLEKLTLVSLRLSGDWIRDRLATFVGRCGVEVRAVGTCVKIAPATRTYGGRTDCGGALTVAAPTTAENSLGRFTETATARLLGAFPWATRSRPLLGRLVIHVSSLCVLAIAHTVRLPASILQDDTVGSVNRTKPLFSKTHGFTHRIGRGAKIVPRG